MANANPPRSIASHSWPTRRGKRSGLPLQRFRMPLKLSFGISSTSSANIVKRHRIRGDLLRLMRGLAFVGAAILKKFRHLRETCGDVAGDLGGPLGGIEMVRVRPHELQTLANGRLA